MSYVLSSGRGDVPFKAFGYFAKPPRQGERFVFIPLWDLNKPYHVLSSILHISQLFELLLHQDVAALVEIPEGNEDEPLTLARRLRKIPESFERYISTTTRQYVGHVLGLVKSYWPRTPLDPLGEGAKADCSDDQFGQYLEETSTIADRIVETLNKSWSP